MCRICKWLHISYTTVCGKVLKLKVPGNSWKTLSGWSNYSGKNLWDLWEQNGWSAGNQSNKSYYKWDPQRLYVVLLFNKKSYLGLVLSLSS